MTVNFYDGAVFYELVAAMTVPAIVLGLLEKPIRLYGTFVSALIIFLALGGNYLSLVYMAVYYAIQLIVIKSMLRIRRKGTPEKLVFHLHVMLTLIPLMIYKFSSMWNVGIMGFIGISYMTFKSIQIVIEINDGLIEEVKTQDLFYFLFFFPSILCGPIDRSRRFLEDAYRVIPKNEYIEMCGNAALLILGGAVMKHVLANVVNMIGVENMYQYGVHMYFDFAGYSMMAVGISNLYGIKTPNNFKKPFLSIDIKDFWNRWHISLSTWFRDYLFSRLLRQSIRGKFFWGNKLAQACFCLLINMTVMGIWHGLEANYILYGIYHGVLLAFTEVYQKKSAFYKKNKKNKWYKVFSWFITMNLVMVGFGIFSGKFI